MVREGGRAIVLVPEISLTPQTAQRFEAAFGDRVAVLHSALSERERFDAWQACARGEIDVVVGARSAVFAPLDRRAAADRRRSARSVVQAGSRAALSRRRGRARADAVATEGVLRARQRDAVARKLRRRERRAGSRSLELRERATAQPLPDVRVVDLRKEFESGNRGIFSSALVQALGERLERGEKSLLFVNRRGSAGALLCRSCGDSPQCPRCSVALSVHRGERLLRCHYCDYQAPIPQRLPGLRIGSDPRARSRHRTRGRRSASPLSASARACAWIPTRRRASAITRAFWRRSKREGDVLVGTQMVAKGSIIRR